MFDQLCKRGQDVASNLSLADVYVVKRADGSKWSLDGGKIPKFVTELSIKGVVP